MSNGFRSDRLRHSLTYNYANFIAEKICLMNESWIDDDLLEDACAYVIDRVAAELEAKNERDPKVQKWIVDKYAELVSIGLYRSNRDQGGYS